MAPLTTTIDALRRRWRRLIVVRGVCWSAAAGLGFVGLAAVLDALVHLHSPALRLGLGGAAVALMAWSLWRSVLRPWLADWSDVSLALLLEQNFPDCRDRLASAVEFAQRTAAGQERSLEQELREVAIRRATEELSAAGLERRLDWRPAGRAAAAFALVAALVVAWVLFSPQTALLALERQVFPYRAAEWPRSTILELLDEELRPLGGGVARGLAGESLTIYIANQQGDVPEDVRLERQTPDGSTEPVETIRTHLRIPGRGECGLAVATLTPEEGVLRLRAVGGDDRTMPWQSWSILPSPRLERFHVRIEPPEYSGLPVLEEDRPVGHVEGLLGSTVHLSAESNVPLREVVLHRDPEPPLPLALDAEGRRVEVRLVIETEGRSVYRWEVTDQFGLAASRPQRFEVRGRADQPPRVELQFPAGAMTVTPHARLPLTAECADDLGLSSVALVTDEGPSAHGSTRRLLADWTVLPAGTSPPRNYRVDATWDLSELARQPGESVEYWMEAADRRQPEPQIGRSRALTLQFVTEAEKLQELRSYQAGMARILARLESRQASAVQTTRELGMQWSLVGAFRDADYAALTQLDLERRRLLGDLTDARTGLASQIRRVRDELAWNQISDETTLQRLHRLHLHLRRIVEEWAPELGTHLNTVRQKLPEPPAPGTEGAGERPGVAEDHPQIGAALNQAAVSQAAIAAALASMLAELSEWQRQLDATRHLEELVAEQRRLREETMAVGARTLTHPLESLPPQDRADLARLADRQRQLSGLLERLQTAWRDPAAASDGRPEGTDRTPHRPLPPSLHEGRLAQQIQRAADHLAANRIGQALADQQAVLQVLEGVLAEVSEWTAPDHEAVRELLQSARQGVETLRRRQEELRRKVPAVRPLSADPAQREELELLRKEQQELADELDQMAQRLRQFLIEPPAQTAARAAARGHSAARSLAEHKDDQALRDQREVLDDLFQLDRELDVAQQAAEQERLRALLAGLAGELRGWVGTQQQLRDVTRRLETLRTEQGRFDRAALRQLAEASQTQQQTADEVGQRAAHLQDLELLHTVLSAAAEDMAAAAKRLAAREVDADTSGLQQAAADRLGALLASLDAAASPPSPDGSQPPSGADSSAAAQSTELFELKLMRGLQAQLLERTRQLSSTAAAQPLDESQREELQRLIESQQQLAARAAELLPHQDPSPPREQPPQPPQSSDAPPDVNPPPSGNDVPPGDRPGRTPAGRRPPSAIDEALTRELESPTKDRRAPSAEAPATPPPEQIPLEMQAAVQELQQQQLADAAARQAAALRALDRLLEQAARQQTTPSPEPSSQTEIAGVGEGRPDETGRSTGIGEGAARESDPNRSGAPRVVAPLERRRNLATSVWGHLPDRLREQMQQSYRERYLPGYEDLVERYYEILAEQQEADRLVPDGRR